MSNEIISTQTDLFTEEEARLIKEYIAGGAPLPVAVCGTTGRALISDGYGHLAFLDPKPTFSDPQPEAGQNSPISPDLSQISPPTVRERPRGFLRKLFPRRK